MSGQQRVDELIDDFVDRSKLSQLEVSFKEAELALAKNHITNIWHPGMTADTAKHLAAAEELQQEYLKYGFQEAADQIRRLLDNHRIPGMSPVTIEKLSWKTRAYWCLLGFVIALFTIQAPNIISSLF